MILDQGFFGPPVPFMRSGRGDVWSEFDGKPAGQRWRRLVLHAPGGRVCLPVDLFGLDEDDVAQAARDDRRVVARRRFGRLFVDSGYIGRAFPELDDRLREISEDVRSAVCQRMARGYDCGSVTTQQTEEQG